MTLYHLLAHQNVSAFGVKTGGTKISRFSTETAEAVWENRPRARARVPATLNCEKIMAMATECKRRMKLSPEIYGLVGFWFYTSLVLGDSG